MNFLMHKLPNGFTVFDELATLVLALLVIAVVLVVIRDMANFAAKAAMKQLPIGTTRNNPIELRSLFRFYAEANTWYRFNGITFHMVGNNWLDENGHEHESDATGNNWL